MIVTSDCERILGGGGGGGEGAHRGIFGEGVWLGSQKPEPISDPCNLVISFRYPYSDLVS